MKKNKLNFKVKGLLPLFFLLAFFGCKKESTEIGVGLRDDLGGINSTSVEYTGITCRTVDEDTFTTDQLRANILGLINDPIFGSRQANLIVQPRITEIGDSLSGKFIDSVKLFLRYDQIQTVGIDPYLLTYGNLESEMEIEVYTLADELATSDRFYSNFDPVLDTKVGQFSGKVDFFDSLVSVINGEVVTSAPQMVITLDNSFGQQIMDFGSDAFSSDTSFTKYLKGLALVPSNVLSGEGAIFGIDANTNSSGLILYYSDTLTKAIPLGSSSKSINYYETGSSGVIDAQKTGTGNFNKTYVNSMGGSKVKVDIPELDAIIEMGDDIVINEASIRFLVDQTTVDTGYKVPSRMFIQIPDTVDGTVHTNSIPFTDLFDRLSPPTFDWTGYTNYGGDYDASINGYSFRFNRYLQEIVKEYKETGVNKFNGFYLSVPSDFPVVPSRVVMNTDSTAGDVKVSITYTKLD